MTPSLKEVTFNVLQNLFLYEFWIYASFEMKFFEQIEKMKWLRYQRVIKSITISKIRDSSLHCADFLHLNVCNVKELQISSCETDLINWHSTIYPHVNIVFQTTQGQT